MASQGCLNSMTEILLMLILSVLLWLALRYMTDFKIPTPILTIVGSLTSSLLVVFGMLLVSLALNHGYLMQEWYYYVVLWIFLSNFICFGWTVLYGTRSQKSG